MPGIGIELFADGFDASDLQLVTDISDAFDDVLVLARIIPIPMTVFPRAQFLKLLLPIPQRGSRHAGLRLRLAKRVLFLFAIHSVFLLSTFYFRLLADFQFLTRTYVVIFQPIPLFELLY